MKDRFTDLVKVKKLREEDAIRALAKAQEHLRACQQAEAAKRQEQADYKAWRLKEEERLYKEIENKPVQRRKLDEVRADIASFHRKALRLQEEALDCEQQTREAEDSLALAKQARQKAWGEVERFEELNDRFEAEAAKEQERQEEDEMEETSLGRR